MDIILKHFIAHRLLPIFSEPRESYWYCGRSSKDACIEMKALILYQKSRGCSFRVHAYLVDIHEIIGSLSNIVYHTFTLIETRERTINSKGAFQDFCRPLSRSAACRAAVPRHKQCILCHFAAAQRHSGTAAAERESGRVA